jgi:acyl-CoA synthetase (AMP-forming)/AMP-acid ligase II
MSAGDRIALESKHSPFCSIWKHGCCRMGCIAVSVYAQYFLIQIHLQARLAGKDSLVVANEAHVYKDLGV